MDQSSIPGPQHFDGGEVFIIHGVLLSLLMGAFVLGLYSAEKKWPHDDSNKNVAIDLLISLPFAIFIVWLLIPRIGLAGDTILASYALGNPTLLTTCLLGFAVLMISGMSFHFALPKLKATLTAIGSQFLVPLERVFGAIFSGQGSIEGGDPPNRPGPRRPRQK